MNFTKTLFLFFVLVLVIGCTNSVVDPEPPPYVISKPICNVVAKEGYYNFAGIELKLANTAKKDIQTIVIKCTVYDSDTKKNPLIGSNQLTFSAPLAIPPGSTQSILLSLDPFIYSAPKAPYLIDFLYVSSIAYADGTSWEDTNGTYYARSY